MLLSLVRPHLYMSLFQFLYFLFLIFSIFSFLILSFLILSLQPISELDMSGCVLTFFGEILNPEMILFLTLK